MFLAALIVGAAVAVVGGVLGSIAVAAIGAVIVAAFGNGYYRPGRASLVGDPLPDPSAMTVFVASDDGFGLDPASTGARTWCPWSHFRWMRAVDDLYLLQHVRMHPAWGKKGRCVPTLIVPMRAFQSAEDAERFRLLATRHIEHGEPD